MSNKGHPGHLKASSPHTSARGEQVCRDARRYLNAGLDLYRWWLDHRESDDFEERFVETTTLNRPHNTSWGFFDTATVRGKAMPIMGNLQTMYYDGPKGEGDDKISVKELCEQLKAFVTKYFLRVSDFQRPRPYDPDYKPAPFMLKPLDLRESDEAQRGGFGFRQLYAKYNDRDAIHSFKTKEQRAVSHLSTIVDDMEWIVLETEINTFGFSYKPFGLSFPEIWTPIPAHTYLVTNSQLITIEDNPSKDVAGRYGVGYAFIRDPVPSYLGYGPGQFSAAFEKLDFIIDHKGRITLEMSFVANQPEKVVNISVDPFVWGARMVNMMSLAMAERTFPALWDPAVRSPLRDVAFDPVLPFLRMADHLTGGRSGKYLGWSPKELSKLFLLMHFQQHYDMAKGSLLTWRQIENWEDTANIPDWIKHGVSS